MSGYIVNDDQTFKNFLRAERILAHGEYPLMSRFAKEETRLILDELEGIDVVTDKIIEIGCGGGRLLNVMKDHGYDCRGFDNDMKSLEHCKNKGLNVFYGDALRKQKTEFKGKFKLAIIGFNTLFNFDRSTRNKWITNASYLLEKKGILVFTVYADNNISRVNMSSRIRFYNDAIRPKKNYLIEFSPIRARIEMKFNNRVVWFSELKKVKELKREIKSWKGFRIKSIKSFSSGIAFLVSLKKL